MWAPEIFRHGNTYYLYYAVSTLGHNDSVIALATNTTLDPKAPGYRWVDQGKVVRSLPASDFNAIDPDIIQDAAGTPWLVFGSYWSGVQMVQLQWPSGKRSADPTRAHLLDRKLPLNAVEGPAMVSHGGWYYLFSSWDRCCVGLKSNYRIVVGRSRSITGPYLDRDGRSLMDGGGTTVLASMSNQIGPGGQSVAGGVLAYHYYDATAAGAPPRDAGPEVVGRRLAAARGGPAARRGGREQRLDDRGPRNPVAVSDSDSAAARRGPPVPVL